MVVPLREFYALPEAHRFVCLATGRMHPAQGVDGRFPPVQVGINKKGEPVYMKATQWLYRHQVADGLTWWPGELQIMPDRIAVEGQIIPRKGAKLVNLYRPPLLMSGGDATKAGRWLDHGRKLYGTEFDHMLAYFAHSVQHPGDKINHALVLGGEQGIGKDTLLYPVLRAVGLWNCHDIKPDQLFGQFTPFYKAVVLVVSEVNDLGDKLRHQFYERTKTLNAAPPTTQTVNEKFLPPYHIPNCCNVVMTTNHKAGGIYLPPGDRRHFVASSSCTMADFGAGYFKRLYALA